MKTLAIFLLFVSVSVAVAAPPADIRQGLIGYWPMDTTDGTAVYDETTFANHMYLANMNSGSFVPGKFGNAGNFLGGTAATTTYMTNLHSADNAATGLPIYRAGSYTVTMWVNGAPQSDRWIFSEGNLGAAATLLVLQTGQNANSNKFDVIIRNDGNTAILNHVASSNVVFDSTWHHVAWVDDRGAARVYIDGNLDPANFNYTPSGTFTFTATAIGNLIRNTIGARGFIGLVDDVAVWERPLSQSEVQNVMTNSLQAPVPALQTYIYREPASVTRAEGDRVTFRAAATGNRPLSYQWTRDGFDIPGATSNSVTLYGLSPGDNGSVFSVRVTNPGGSVTSTPATLTVLTDPPTDVPQGLISYWPFDEIDYTEAPSTPDLYSGNHFRLNYQAIVDPVGGIFFNAVPFNGVDQYGTRSGGFPIYNNSAFSIAFWVNGNAGQLNRRVFAESSLSVTNQLFAFGTHNTGADGTLRVFIRNNLNAVSRDRQSTRTVFDGNWHHVVYTETNGTAKLYVDGVLDESDFDYVRSPLTVDTSAIAARVSTSVSEHFAGALDDMAVWNRVLTFTEVNEIRTAGVPPPISAIPPEITRQPTNQTVFTQGTAVLSVVALGTSPLQVQWRKGGVPINDETNFTLVFSNVTLSAAGQYDVTITNSAGSVTSVVAVLTVLQRPAPPAQLKIDFNNIGQEGVGETQPGFGSFTLDAFTPGPHVRLFGGVEATVVGAGGVNLESRLRAGPANGPGFTESQIFRDFIFSRDATTADGIDVTLGFLDTNRMYDVIVWSWDDESTGNRVSDWYANGTPVQLEYTFDGAATPPIDGQNRIAFIAQADNDGRLLIQGRRASSATVNLNVFMNALQLTRRDLRILSIDRPAPDSLRLTVRRPNPGANIRIEQITNLTDTAWGEVIGASYGPVNGDVQEVALPVPNTTTRFYRAAEAP